MPAPCVISTSDSARRRLYAATTVVRPTERRQQPLALWIGPCAVLGHTDYYRSRRESDSRSRETYLRQLNESHARVLEVTIAWQFAMAPDYPASSRIPGATRRRVKLPREERRHLEPPSAEHVEAELRLLPRDYRLPDLVLDATGTRVNEL